jgi:hypothetical protein
VIATAAVRTKTTTTAQGRFVVRVCNEYKAGLDLAIERGWLVLHESGTFVRFKEGGAELFA